MIETEVVILDLETTGLSPFYDKITEIAAIKYVNGIEKERFHTLINPERRIPRFITALTGITNEMVQDAPTIKEILPSLKEFLKDNIIVAHNATFDYNFLKYNFETHLQEEFKNEKICTAKLARRIHSDLPSKRLSALSEHYGIRQEIKHRALNDTITTCEIYKKMIIKLNECEVIEKEEIFYFQNMPIRKAIEILNKKKEK